MIEDFVDRVICGDTRQVLKDLPDRSVDCVVTSPPYWGLRDYGIEPQIWDGDGKCEHRWDLETKVGDIRFRKGYNTTVGNQKNPEVWQGNGKGNFCSLCSAWKGSLGLEPTPELYIKHLVGIFDEIKRVLKKTGTCWVNIGDSYSGSWGNRSHKPNTKHLNRIDTMSPEDTPPTANLKSVQPKSLVGIPEMFVLEMQKRGWIRRNTIIWYKPNCMPSSASDRFTVDFEYLYFFTKNTEPVFWTNSKTGEMVNKQQGLRGKTGNGKDVQNVFRLRYRANVTIPL